MAAPRWTRWLLRRLAPRERADDLLGDLEEAHRRRVERRGRPLAALLTTVEALDVALALARERVGGSAAVSLLDFKLALRMLVKHPGLSVVGIVAMAFGIGFGAVLFQIVTDFIHPDLRLPEGDRVVELEQGEDRQVLHDFVTWRAELGSVDDLSAYRTARHNLITDDRGTALITVAEVNASAFRVTRTPPLLGRTLLDADERSGAPAVLVLGHDVWRTHFASDANVVGRTVRLGDVATTVVGVMPDGFRFPLDHDAWTPLRLDPLDYERGRAPTLDVFGRLAPGSSLEEAQAELTTLGLLAAADHPETNARRRPVVRRYRGGFLHGSERVMFGTYSLIAIIPALILVLVCANIALLVFARTAARESEIAVRSALGAGRTRILLQLFIESLVLAGVSAAVGVYAGDTVLARTAAVMSQAVVIPLPYWFHDGFTGTTLLYAGLFTVLGALIVGLLPALLVTRSGLRTRLGSATAGGGGLRMGRLWSGVIVTQVAVTIALVPFMGLALRIGAPAFWPAGGFAAHEYLVAELEIEGGLDGVHEELKERLRVEPDVRGVTLMGFRSLPGAGHGERRIEVEGLDEPSAVTSTSLVDRDFFEVLNLPMLAGRAFDARDVEAGAPVVVANEAFVDGLGGPSAIGRRIRSPVPREPGDLIATGDEWVWSPWHEIVGVVRDAPIRVGVDATDDQTRRLYFPLPATATRLGVAVHVAGDPSSLAPRVRALAADVDPTLQLRGLAPLDARIATDVRLMATAIGIVVLGGLLALLLSNAGIYSAMAFAVSRRTREIGIRVALGAGRTGIVTAILGRAFLQVTAGICGGALFLYLVMRYQSGEGLLLWWDANEETVSFLEALGSCAAYGVVVMAVCALACLVPTRRALSVEPTEALRAEA